MTTSYHFVEINGNMTIRIKRIKLIHNKWNTVTKMYEVVFGGFIGTTDTQKLIVSFSFSPNSSSQKLSEENLLTDATSITLHVRSEIYPLGTDYYEKPVITFRIDRYHPFLPK